jgi:PEP-CTERM motif
VGHMFNFAAAVIAFATASAASAAVTVDFTNVRGEWFDVALIGGPALGFTGNNTANASVRWGTSTGFGRSGYDFAAIGIPQLVLTPPNASAVTTIGRFTHVNQPISAGTSISSAKLRFSTDVFVNGNFLDTVSFIYDFDHDETPNGANPCAYGGANNVGVNINGCADRVNTVFNSQSEFFTIGGTDYALDVVGFMVGNSNIPVMDFLTTEQANSSAFILGRIVPYSSAVPEASSWVMLIAGFGLVGAARRRQQALRNVAA